MKGSSEEGREPVYKQVGLGGAGRRERGEKEKTKKGIRRATEGARRGSVEKTE